MPKRWRESVYSPWLEGVATKASAENSAAQAKNSHAAPG
jgi:hypothetical protein